MRLPTFEGEGPCALAFDATATSLAIGFETGRILVIRLSGGAPVVDAGLDRQTEVRPSPRLPLGTAYGLRAFASG
jgi:hypothetical protein